MVLDNALALGSRVTAAFGQGYATSEEWASLLASRYGAESVSGSAAESIATPYGSAIQALTPEAQAALEEVQSGATVYKGGVLGRSEMGASQFLSHGESA